jgi:hypothetical protein
LDDLQAFDVCFGTIYEHWGSIGKNGSN